MGTLLKQDLLQQLVATRKEDRLRLDTREKYFTMRVVKHWDIACRNSRYPIPGNIQSQADGALSNFRQQKLSLCIAQKMTFKGLFEATVFNESMIMLGIHCCHKT